MLLGCVCTVSAPHPTKLLTALTRSEDLAEWIQQNDETGSAGDQNMRGGLGLSFTLNPFQLAVRDSVVHLEGAIKLLLSSCFST